MFRQQSPHERSFSLCPLPHVPMVVDRLERRSNREDSTPPSLGARTIVPGNTRSRLRPRQLRLHLAPEFLRWLRLACHGGVGAPLRLRHGLSVLLDVRPLERATGCFRFCCRCGRQDHKHAAALGPGRQQIVLDRRSRRRFVRGEARIGSARRLVKEYQNQYQTSGHSTVGADVDRKRCAQMIDALLSRTRSHTLRTGGEPLRSAIARCLHRKPRPWPEHSARLKRRPRFAGSQSWLLLLTRPGSLCGARESADETLDDQTTVIRRR
jgi:hypothetical protein